MYSLSFFISVIQDPDPVSTYGALEPDSDQSF